MDRRRIRTSSQGYRVHTRHSRIRNKFADLQWIRRFLIRDADGFRPRHHDSRRFATDSRTDIRGFALTIRTQRHKSQCRFCLRGRTIANFRACNDLIKLVDTGVYTGTHHCNRALPGADVTRHSRNAKPPPHAECPTASHRRPITRSRLVTPCDPLWPPCDPPCDPPVNHLVTLVVTP
jgi:hypothetical protein